MNTTDERLHRDGRWINRSDLPRITYIPDHEIPSWVRTIPGRLLWFVTYEGHPDLNRCTDLLAWLDERGLPRPTLLLLASERRRREQVQAQQQERERTRRPGTRRDTPVTHAPDARR